MKKLTIFIVLAILCLNFNAKAQEPISEIKPLKIGEHLPDTLRSKIFEATNAKNERLSISLQNYKGKLILLDFWATWCTNCIVKFPTLDSLQQQYGKQLQVILVNTPFRKDTPKTIAAKLANAPNLPSIISDDTLKAYFPHTYIPHYVWLGAKGELLALSNSDWVNPQMVKLMLAQYGRQKATDHEIKN